MQWVLQKPTTQKDLLTGFSPSPIITSSNRSLSFLLKLCPMCPVLICLAQAFSHLILLWQKIPRPLNLLLSLCLRLLRATVSSEAVRCGERHRLNEWLTHYRAFIFCMPLPQHVTTFSGVPDIHRKMGTCATTAQNINLALEEQDAGGKFFTSHNQCMWLDKSG